MKSNSILLSTLLLLGLFSFTSCEENTLRLAMEAVEPCNQVDLTPENHISDYEAELGTIREITVWLPPATSTAIPTLKNDEPVEHRLWVIMPDAYPEVMLEPCNLPADQLTPNRRISFSGLSLKEQPEVSNLEGITPFMLTEITSVEDDHQDMTWDDC